MNFAPSDSIQIISHTKLREFYNTRTEPSIRKYVLITNLLRANEADYGFPEQEEPVPSLLYDKDEEKEIVLEQEWLDTCLDGLDDYDDDDDDEDYDVDDSYLRATAQPYEPHLFRSPKPQANTRQQGARTEAEANNKTSINTFGNDFREDQPFPFASQGKACPVLESMDTTEHPSSSPLPSSPTTTATTPSSHVLTMKNDFSPYNSYSYRNLCGAWSIV